MELRTRTFYEIQHLWAFSNISLGGQLNLIHFEVLHADQSTVIQSSGKRKVK